MQTGASTLVDEELKQLGQLFQRRLQQDRAKLGVLAAKFASADAAPADVLEEIRFFAHRLHGAAAIFAAHELSHSARALEAAATTPTTGCAGEMHSSMSSLLDSLYGQLSLRIENDTVMQPTVAETQ
jgi:HPt (histidine-containing phosphotransfer) domain-containing protein